MAIKVKAIERNVAFGNGQTKYAYVLQADLYIRVASGSSDFIPNTFELLPARRKLTCSYCKVLSARRIPTCSNCKVLPARRKLTCSNCKVLSARRIPTCSNCKALPARRKPTCSNCKSLSAYRIPTHRKIRKRYVWIVPYFPLVLWF